MEVNVKIKAYIKDRGLKQNRIAARAGLSSQKFSAMLNCKRRIYAEELAAICNALDADPKLFLT
jgi:DNA-binding Xre family transcriptional regulator